MMKNDIRVAERNGGCGDFTGNHFLRLFVRNQWVEGGLAHQAYLAVLCNIRVRPRRGAAVAEWTGLRPPALRPKPSGKPARILGANQSCSQYEGMKRLFIRAKLNVSGKP
jgi:hypothetical protein